MKEFLLLIRPVQKFKVQSEFTLKNFGGENRKEPETLT